MKIAQINGGAKGSTGKIMFGIEEVAKDFDIACICFSPITSTNKTKENKNYQVIGNFYLRKFNILLNRLFNREGCFSWFSTKKVLRKLKKEKIDLIHLHNMHNNFINLPMLFKFIKKHNIKTVWTLHDCWAFTGHCPYFDIANCKKWKEQCHHCSQYKDYPKSFFDNSKKMYKLKKKWFLGVKNLTLITPSKWLAGLVNESFLKDYPVKVINTGIDLNIFKPKKSDFREKYNLQDKFIVLGVAFGWGKRKGLDVFIELSKRLSEKYQIVLVGTDDNVDKQLPKNIISIHRTQNQIELAEIYSSADVFANPTREEVLGLVNLEALASGTPGITFNSGGSPECYDKNSGIVVEYNNIDQMEKEIIWVCEEKPFNRQDCIKRASTFNQEQKFKEYIDIYKEL